MNSDLSSEEPVNPLEDEPLPLRPWEQIALGELATIIQGLCSSGYPQPGDLVFALRDLAACVDELTQGETR